MRADLTALRKYSPEELDAEMDLLAQRFLDSSAQFFARHLCRGLSVLDCGCGSGTVTLGLAARADPGRVVGVDVAQREIERARAILSRFPTLKNLSFQVADIRALPFEEGTFDRVFSHAVIEHIAEPMLALREIHRVLKPGGLVGLANSDWCGSMLLPPAEGLVRAFERPGPLRLRNNVEVNVGRKLAEHLIVAGFDILNLSARSENHYQRDASLAQLTRDLDCADDIESAVAAYSCSDDSASIFAESWISAVARKPV